MFNKIKNKPMFYKLRLILAILASAFDKIERNFSILKYNNKIIYNKNSN